MSARPRVVFMGTPEFAVPALRAVARGCDVCAVITQPDRPRGRGLKLVPSEVALAAEELGLRVLKPETMKSDAVRAEITALAPELFAVVAFGAILSPSWLATPRLGAINLHGSLLPEYRGAAPVQRALWDGRAYSGVTTIWMDEGIDTGDMILQAWEPIAPADTAATLAARLAERGAPLLAESLVLAASGRAPRQRQAGTGSYAKKLAKKDGVVDWTLDAVTVWNHQRALTPWPGATATWEGKGVTILECAPRDLLPGVGAPGEVLEVGAQAVRVACGVGTLEVMRVKPEGRPAMSAADWARGVRAARGKGFTGNLEWSKEEAS